MNCSAKPCNREAEITGLCQAHYRRKKRGRPVAGQILKPHGRKSESKSSEMVTVSTRLPKAVAKKLRAIANKIGISPYELNANLLKDRLISSQSKK